MLAPALDRVGAVLADAGIPATLVTAAGFAAGVGACLGVAAQAWTLGLVLWLANRLLDGLDGPVARRRGPTEVGGFLDIMADFAVYSGMVLALAVAVPSARLACVALMVAYYLSGTAFLAVSSLLERQRSIGAGSRYDDGRSLRFVGGLAEGTETVLVYTAICLLPSHATFIAWAFAVAVAVTGVQRVLLGVSLLAPTTVTTDPATTTVADERARPDGVYQPAGGQPTPRLGGQPDHV